MTSDKVPNDISTDAESALDETSFDSEPQLQRKLKNRHVSLIALAGIIGPGILIGASLALKNGGPASLIIGFGIIGLIAFIMMQSLGELSTLYPTGGAFSTLGIKFVDKAFGLTVGWYYVIIWIAVLANEYNVTASILRFWGPQVPLYGYVLIFYAAFMGFQFLGVGAFGEAEYWLALTKIVGMIAFYIFSIIYVSGGVKGNPAFGFHYWNEPGAFAQGFKGVVSTFVFASTFYSGVEAVAIAASETRNPGKAIPAAIRQTFFRIIFIYMGISVSYGMTVPFDDEDLTNEKSTLKSPMSIAIRRAGWDGGVHLINAFILLTCVSAINSSIYIGSRTIVNLAREGGAPSFLGYIHKRNGVPYPAIILMNSFGLLSLMNISTGAAKAYSYIVNLSGVSVFIVWGSVSFMQIRLRKAWKLQGRDVKDMPYKAWGYPFLPWLSITLNLLLALIQGWSYFKPFQAGDWVDAYVLLPVFFIMYFGYKIWHKSKWVNLNEIDLDEGRRIDLDTK